MEVFGIRAGLAGGGVFIGPRFNPFWGRKLPATGFVDLVSFFLFFDTSADQL